ncbi:hypothetical protein H9L21_10175 [Aeromicrobium senzhongii]|uniref:DUF3558 domain-containing protein n=1 Tax=Aeromicrobium senzhongii TaxID=2663859 RepID=A0ABX6SQ55_9ACTN|nr:hypothetical protein [Aeromicrobium senzhongii]MTB89254.1 hypothetical protein [Aeromicrobium senzhongii]QNL93483.1 hypothetical protein H9L21_10175 [Aeromicrobium senzhongii]
MSSLLAASGCQEPSYDAERACSIPTDVLAAVLGTDRFSAPSERIERLPFTETSTRGSAGCRIDAGDVSLYAEALVLPSTEIPQREEVIRSESDSFALLDGIARADGRRGGWVCGSVAVSVELDGNRDADPSDMRAAIEAVADEAGCYTAPPRPWDPATTGTS